MPPDENHRDHRADAARRHDDAGGDGRIAEDRRQHRRQQRQARQQDDADDEDEHQPGREIAVDEDLRVDERVFATSARWTMNTQKPVMARPSSIQISTAENQSTSPPRSSISCSAPTPSDSMAKPKKSKPRSALGDARQIGGHAEEGEDADRQVDEEHPAPVEAVGQPAAQRRPDDRPDHDAGAPDGHRLAVALLRVDVEQEGLRQRHDRRAEHALQQRGTAPCSPGSRRCRRASR